ncbi:hypothetical protein, partial [Mycobacterium tuberculosis]|uniref:hypothetical protein n=1 Tax=Mycobacterium tuberculosis TaxID=1773 RepID=UPI001F1D14B5
MTRDPHSPDCGREGSYRDTITRPLTDLPVAGYPLVPRVASPRYRCTTPQCGRAVFNQDLANVDQYLVVNQLAHQLIDGSEPPRHVRRLQFLERMGSCQVVHRGG